MLGGAAYAHATPEQTAASVEEALFAGVNHLDVAPSYGDAEVNLGPLVEEHRERLFVACKTHRKNPDGVRAQLEESLATLRTDTFDLYQVHGVTDLEDLEARADAFAVVLAARDEGLVHYVGVTGHELGTAAAQLTAVQRYDLDTVMFPLSPRLWSVESYREDVAALLAHCRTHDIGVHAIKSVSWRLWPEGATKDLDTWYEPHRDDALIRRGTDFALSTPGVHCIVTPSDRSLLPRVLAAADKPAFVSTSKRKSMIQDAASEPLIFS